MFLLIKLTIKYIFTSLFVGCRIRITRNIRTAAKVIANATVTKVSWNSMWCPFIIVAQNSAVNIPITEKYGLIDSWLYPQNYEK